MTFFSFLSSFHVISGKHDHSTATTKPAYSRRFAQQSLDFRAWYSNFLQPKNKFKISEVEERKPLLFPFRLAQKPS